MIGEGCVLPMVLCRWSSAKIEQLSICRSLWRALALSAQHKDLSWKTLGEIAAWSMGRMGCMAQSALHGLHVREVENSAVPMIPWPGLSLPCFSVE